MRRVAAVAIVLLAAIGIGLAFVFPHPRLLLPTLLGAGTIVVALVPFIRRGRRLDIFEPVVPACAFLAVLFGVRALTVLHESALVYDGQPFSQSDLTRAIAAGFIGTLGFVIGYEIWAARGPVPRRVGGVGGDIRAAREFAVFATIAGIGLFVMNLSRGSSILGTLRLMLHGRSSELGTIFQSSSEYLSSAPILASCGALVVILCAGARKLSRAEWTLIAVTSLVPVILFGLTGSRRFVIPAVGVPLVALYVVRGRRPRWRWVAIAGIAAFLVLAVVPYERSQGARQNSGGVVRIAVRAVEHPKDVMSQFINGNDTEDLSTLALEIRALPHPGDFYYGRATVGDVILAPIPTMLIPSKPTTARNSLLVKVFGLPCDPTSGGCPDFSVVGSFYQDFWYPGVFLEMALLGIAAAAIWRRGGSRGSSPTATAAAAVTTVFLPIIIRAGWMPAFAWSLYFFVPTAVGLALTRLAARVERSRVVAVDASA